MRLMFRWDWTDECAMDTPDFGMALWPASTSESAQMHFAMSAPAIVGALARRCLRGNGLRGGRLAAGSGTLDLSKKLRSLNMRLLRACP